MRKFLALLLLLAFCGCNQPCKCTYKCCEGLDTGICHCNETGICLCEPGGRSCPACKDKLPPAEEHAAKQAKLLEQAKRAKN